MISDGRKIPDSSELDCDLCIIGAGAAGITIAREFIGGGARVIVLESGGLEPDADTQDLYDGQQDGVPYPDTIYSARLRFFGGTTNHWTAFCSPWTETDFRERPWKLNSGWPISLSDVMPYYQKAFKTCRLGAHSEWDWDAKSWLQRLGLEGDFMEGSVFEAQVMQRAFSKYEDYPNSFGLEYRQDLEQAKSVEVLLNSNVVDIVTADDERVVSSLQVVTFAGNRFTVRAGTYVLATGGIENARLLLSSTSSMPNGLGNEHDNVGRYFMDHIQVPVAGRFYPRDTDPAAHRLYSPNETTGGNVYCQIRTPEDFIEAEKMNAAYISLRPQLDKDYVAASESDGVNALNEMLDNFSEGTLPTELGEKFTDVVTDADDILASLFRKIYHGEIPIAHYNCLVRFDPTPVRDSRVTLTDEVDPLGMRRVKLTWAVHDVDKTNVARLIDIFGREIGRLDAGRVQRNFDPDKPLPENLDVGWHHMGTTKMSSNPETGVVDRNCRVHSTENLYVAGSSVFATAGSGTPTMLIVSLALRLADHLKETRGIR